MGLAERSLFKGIRLIQMVRILITLFKTGNLKHILTIVFLILLGQFVQAQADSSWLPSDTLPRDYFLLHTVERDGVTLPEIKIKEVLILGKPSSGKKFPYGQYQRLIANLKKVYPYALVVRSKLETINRDLQNIPDDKEKRKYIRQTEKNLFGEYEKDIRNMTITQGRLLIKLIDRETQNTSYELIRFYRGNLTAAFWQGIARIFGTNLKAEYDAYGEDALMEILLQAIESGTI